MNVGSRVIGVITAFCLLVTMTACGTNQSVRGGKTPNKLEIVATLFPQYDFIRQIGKDKVSVTLLLPPGVESHSFEPTPADIVKISKSSMFVYTGSSMEPWAGKILGSVKGGRTLIVDAGTGIDLMEEQTPHTDGAHDTRHHDTHVEGDTLHADGFAPGGKDPHIWLDPVLAQQMVDTILEGLVNIDGPNEGFYRQNAKLYKEALAQLDRRFSEAFQNIRSRTIVYGGHFAFGYFAKRYGLKHISPYEGFSPSAEPNPKKIVELTKKLRESGSTAIYFEENIEPKVARVIADQTGAKMLILHGVHNISKQELKQGRTYIDIMEQNLVNLKEGLGYGG